MISMLFFEEHSVNFIWLVFSLIALGYLIRVFSVYGTLIFQYWVLLIDVLICAILILCLLAFLAHKASKYIVRISKRSVGFGHLVYVKDIPISSIRKAVFQEKNHTDSPTTKKINLMGFSGTSVKIESNDGREYFFTIEDVKEARNILVNLLGEEKVLTA